jgi:L-alanine-DL-glutamate epimerase-like enolase superfamily enzyme
VGGGRFTFTEILTDEGITGYTRGGDNPLFDRLMGFVVGEDPMNVERIWDKLYWNTFDYGRRGAMMLVQSAIDIGLWDIIGKKLGQPVYKLLGGFRDEVPAYATSIDLGWTLEEVVEEKVEQVELGFNAVKMKVGRRDWREDIQRVKAVRDAIGGDIDLMVDANNGWSVSNAIRMAHRLERFEVDWLEEPVIAEDYEGYAQVRAATEIPIAGGESVHTKWDFRELITRGCIDIVQADVYRCGGITEWVKIATLAETYNLSMAPHAGGRVSATIVAAVPNGLIVESFERSQYKKPVTTMLKFQQDTGLNFYKIDLMPRKGWIKLPQEPGLGLDPNLDAIELYRQKYPITREEWLRDLTPTRIMIRPLNNNMFRSISRRGQYHAEKNGEGWVRE